MTAILDFPLPVSFRLVEQHCSFPHLLAKPWKHRHGRWNCVYILCTSWDIHFGRLEAAILDCFQFLVSSRLVVQHYHYPHFIVGFQKDRYGGWNFVDNLCLSKDIHFKSLEAWIFHFRSHRTDTFTHSSIGMAVIGNGGSSWNFVSISSRSRDMPGGILTAPISNERLKNRIIS